MVDLLLQNALVNLTDKWQNFTYFKVISMREESISCSTESKLFKQLQVAQSPFNSFQVMYP